jgi:outer membrane protein OmpA-like peptidoglycan-associated protein
VRDFGLIFSALLGCIVAGPLPALTLDLPAAVIGEERRSEVPGSYALPLAVFDGKAVPVRQAEGAVDQRAYRLDAAGLTTLAVMGPLRDQVVAAGFTVILDCEARACGGFDFRFGTEVMPEPEMHVDMSDFRFLSAEKDGEVVSLLVSRSALSAFVQVTRVTAVPEGTGPDTPKLAVVDLDETEVTRRLGDSGDIGMALDAEGAAALDDLVFASGAAALEVGDYASLTAVVAWLAANPDSTVALVGHTDASGSLVANIALSERRAEAVRQVLTDQYGVDGARVTAEGVGFLAPRATNQTEEGRQKNRRVEVVVTSTR